MATAMDVIRYMASLGCHFSGEVYAQKLVYYAQAWTVTWDGEPLFDEEIEAWDMGPVVRSLRHTMGTPRQIQPSPDPNPPFTEQQKLNIQAVLKYYGPMSTDDLINLTHNESPWCTIRNAPGATNHEAIPLGLMCAEYTRQSLSGKGPRRLFLGSTAAPDTCVHAQANESAQRWSEALALLAR